MRPDYRLLPWILLGAAVIAIVAQVNALEMASAQQPTPVADPAWQHQLEREAGRKIPPPSGWTTAARITEVYDGDTITVEVTRRFRVRLLDCWAPEIRTRDAEEKARGLEAASHLTALAEGRDAILHVPLEGIDAADAWSFGRVLGHVWVVGDDVSLSVRMVEAGHATKTKN